MSFKSVLGEIMSTKTIDYINFVSKQYCVNGEYDPLDNYEYDYEYEDEDSARQKNYNDNLYIGGWSWCIGQNGEQWASDI
jgi:hypothetical protein